MVIAALVRQVNQKRQWACGLWVFGLAVVSSRAGDQPLAPLADLLAETTQSCPARYVTRLA